MQTSLHHLLKLHSKVKLLLFTRVTLCKDWELKTNLALIFSVFTLAACSATMPVAYQQDRKPEDRTEYNGLDGMAQYQKDQSYLMNKELKDKCDRARGDLAVAISTQDLNAKQQHEMQIKRTCL